MILSMEMHCSVPQQRMIATMMIEHIGEPLLQVCHLRTARLSNTCVTYRLMLATQYKQLVETGRGTSIGPQHLLRRVLVKGKVKQLTNDVSRANRMAARLCGLAVSSTAAVASTASATAEPVARSAAGVQLGFRPGTRRSTTEIGEETMRRSTPEPPASQLQSNDSVHSSNHNLTTAKSRRSSSGKTDSVYAGYLSLRSVPIE